MFTALACLPAVGLASACTQPGPPPQPQTVVSLAPPTSTTEAPTTTLAPTTTTDAPTTTTEAPTTSEVPTTSVLETPTTETPSAPWDWHAHFSPYELAPHQAYSNDCGVTAVRAELRAHGLDATQDEIFDDAIAGHFHAGRAKGNGWNGPYKMVDYLQTFGLDARMEAFNQSNVQQLVDEGKPFIVSTERHYFVISGEEDGRLIAGATGQVVGFGDTLTYNQLSSFGGAHRIIVVDSSDALEPIREPLVSLNS